MKKMEAIARVLRYFLKNKRQPLTQKEMLNVEVFSLPIDFEHKVKRKVTEYHFIELGPGLKFYIVYKTERDSFLIFEVKQGALLDPEKDKPILEINSEVIEDIYYWINRYNPSKRKKRN